MKKIEIKKIANIAEKLEWSVSINDNDFELSKYSPAGQDFYIYISAEDLEDLEDFADNLNERYNDFDVSEEAYLWLDDSGHGKNGSPYDMKDLYEDMEACQEMIKELADEIQKHI